MWVWSLFITAVPFRLGCDTVRLRASYGRQGRSQGCPAWKRVWWKDQSCRAVHSRKVQRSSALPERELARDWLSAVVCVCVCVWRDMGMVWTDGWCDRQQCVLLVSCSTQYSCSGRRWCVRCLDCTELCAILCVNIAFKATPCTKLQRFWLHVCMYSKWS